MNDNKKTIKGFKAFNPGLTCRDFKFEVGKTYEHNGDVKICASGFHFCENPFAVWEYYPVTSEFARVTGAEDLTTEGNKTVCRSLTIDAKISLDDMIKEGVKFIHAQIDWKNPVNVTGADKSNAATSGNNSNAATSGYKSNAATSGDKSNAATSGNYSNAATSGYNSNAATSGNYSNAATSGYKSNAVTSGDNTIAAAIGINSKAKANKDSWIVVAEWVCENNAWKIKTVLTSIVDGNTIKADTFYQVKNGIFVECSN